MRLDLQALHTHIVVRVEDSDVARTLSSALIDLVPDGSARRASHGVRVRGTGPWQVTSPLGVSDVAALPELVSRVLMAVNLTAIRCTPLLCFHAAVATRNGCTVVLPGRSGTGKSTLTASLLRRGWKYVSDEALAVDWATGQVVSYPRPLAMSPWSCATAGGVSGIAAEGETVFTAADLDSKVDRRPGPVTHVVLLDRSATAEAPQLSAVDRNDALAELLQRGFTFHRDPARALPIAVDLLRNSSSLRLRLGHPADAADLLTQSTEGLSADNSCASP